MLNKGHRQISRGRGSIQPTVQGEIVELHRRCGVYTKPEVVCRILDAVGWRADIDLTRSRLLEPAAGDGAFVVEAVRRLIISCRVNGISLRSDTLVSCIRSFEIHRAEAVRARKRVFETLLELGVHLRTSKALAKAWVVRGDFLLSQMPADRFTHAVGNPPYVRWSKIPTTLKAKYEQRLPREMIGGDLFLPFLDRTLDQLLPEGKCGLLCSDRWRFMAFAEGFRTKWLPQLEIDSEQSVLAIDAFVEDVDAYPTILIARRSRGDRNVNFAPAIRTRRTLGESSYIVRVGPALGHTAAFVLQPDENDVEQELLRPWIDASEISEGAVVWRGRQIVTMYSDDAKLIDPAHFPMLQARLKRFEKKLRRRSIVQNGAPWFRPIDRVRSSDWTLPKLLIPELAKIPRLALDRSGAIPSHGVYAIFAPEKNIDILYEKLADGGLARALFGLAPKVKGGYFRCYKRFLEQIVLS